MFWHDSTSIHDGMNGDTGHLTWKGKSTFFVTPRHPLDVRLNGRSGTSCSKERTRSLEPLQILVFGSKRHMDWFQELRGFKNGAIRAPPRSWPKMDDLVPVVVRNAQGVSSPCKVAADVIGFLEAGGVL